MICDCIWMDGELVPHDQAMVHILTPTLHYGMGVFEGIRCYDTAKGPAVFRLCEHLQRFIDSAVVPVREIDFRVIGDGSKGIVTDALQEAFFKAIHGQGARSYEWLEFVDETVYAV